MLPVLPDELLHGAPIDPAIHDDQVVFRVAVEHVGAAAEGDSCRLGGTREPLTTGVQIPALGIDGHLVLHGRVPGVTELASTIKKAAVGRP